MGLHQCVHCPASRQDTAIADDHGLVFDADLNGRTVHIAVMHNRVVHSLTHRSSGKRIGLLPAVVLEGDFCLEVFQVNQMPDKNIVFHLRNGCEEIVPLAEVQ